MKHGLQPTTDLTAGIVGWEIWLLSAITLLTPFATSVLSPAINTIDAEFDNPDAAVGSLTVSIYLFGYVVGPLFIGPLSEIYGRKIILCVANLFFCLWQLGFALAPNLATGIGGAACLALGGSITGDMFRHEERGFAMGMWTLGPLFGPVIGPLIGGFLTERIGWRWDFWIVLAASAPVTVLIMILTKETCHKVLIEQKTVELQRSEGRSDIRSCYDETQVNGTWSILRTSLLRPLKVMFLSPIVFFLSLYVAFIFGVVYLLYTTLPTVFEDENNFSTEQTGYPYIALGIWNISAWLLFTLLSDKLVLKLTAANNGVFTPEMRLITSIPSGILLPIILFWYGWSSLYKLPWPSRILSLVPFGLGIVGLYLPISTYIVDSYPIYAASATSANVIFRSVVGALLPLAGPPFSLLGFVCVVMVPLPYVFYRIGGRLRAKQRFSL
ncbi:MFS general substrate transporter [Dissoconium aciculare CBS 342.82]|uniref:MFS general substrate transporter n=1 Tax=Dissoconium aciculare CBS 342.82 TaxID=1314786 RepID=A0A6J3MGG3_9PEZI|nr:MFS general substrate transporter [Dissoconium aciculare CBS 342.82]KAF1826769.1 MFS general substrate transporter [Dissoconium aciculare CBS 342.82]